MVSFCTKRKSRQILIGLDAVRQRLATRVNRALRGTDLPYAQFLILNHLASLPGQVWTVTRLASVLETGQPGVSKVIQRLAAKGFLQIHPDPEDARVKHHLLTESGQAAHRDAFQRVTPQAEDIFRGWEDKDIDALHGLLLRLKAGLRDARH